MRTDSEVATEIKALIERLNEVGREAVKQDIHFELEDTGAFNKSKDDYIRLKVKVRKVL